jgi:hypothetical protein
MSVEGSSKSWITSFRERCDGEEYGGGTYVVGDALSVMQGMKNEVVDVVHLDDAWKRPRRCDYGHESADGTQASGTLYPTHPFDTDWDEEIADVTTSELIDQSKRVLKDGGWLLVTADDWLLSKVIPYLRENWGDVAATYRGGGYRRVGGVTYVTKSDGTPDRSTAGHYLTNGGYPVVFAHKGETDRKTSQSARQLAHQVRADHGWGTEKPVSPYEGWLEGLTKEGDVLLEPCAGTAPASLAMESLYGDDGEWVAIDIEEEARTAYERRRNDFLDEQ